MISFISSTIPTAKATATATALSPSPIFSIHNSRHIKTHANQTQCFKVSCNTSSNDNFKTSETPKTSFDMQNNVDRRKLLLGLGGLYGAGSFTIPSSFATPITAPNNISDCIPAKSGINHINEAARGTACCPPVLSEQPPKDYVLPKESAIRIRPAAQRVSDDYLHKYKKAIRAMRDLPDDDPRSFKQQAKIHCAYCNGGYSQKQTGFPDKEIQIHNSWLFFPFHRWYIYFYERILGSLINDPTFAIPYWNWDNPTGMTIPDIFETPKPVSENPKPETTDPRTNPLFNAYRDATHLPPAIVNISLDPKDQSRSCIEQIGNNLSTMYRDMISNAPDTTSFFGGKYVAGMDNKDNKLTGSVERSSHTAVHVWASDPRMPNMEDMGNFYSAGYDPLFYVHHANVDRMWHIWKDLDIRGHHDPTDPDWLDASYVFYDENKQLVRVYNRDCCDIKLMGYDYETSQIPWSRSRPVPYTTNLNRVTYRSSRALERVDKVEDMEFPLKLDKQQKMLVKRPAVNRSKEEKKKASEMLMINGIRFDSEKFVKFDVLVNDKDDEVETTAADSQFAGSFAQLPHNQTNQMFMTSAVRFGLTELLEDMKSEDDDYILVTLEPRIGCEDATVAEIKIELVPVD